RRGGARERSAVGNRGFCGVSGVLGSLIASLPAWHQIDPLLVVGHDEENDIDWDDKRDTFEADADEMAVSMLMESTQDRSVTPD
ncbi:MAG: hypothetical protein ABI612_19835, partial [Betaproteobacteria bacterium]